MGAAANKQFRGGNPSTTNDPKAVAVKLIVEALTKFQKNYPNERLGIDNPQSYDPTLFKRTVMEAAAEFRCEHALAELTEKDVEELGLQYCESISQQSIPLANTRPPSLGRPASLGGRGSSGGGGGGSTSNSVHHHTELLVEDVMDQDVDDPTGAGGGGGNNHMLTTTVVAPPSSSSSSSTSTRRRPLFDETNGISTSSTSSNNNRSTTTMIPASPLAAGRMTPVDRPNSSHEMSYAGNNLRTSSSQRNLSSASLLPRPLSSGGSHERGGGPSSHGNGSMMGNINLSSPMGSHAANRSVQPFEAFPVDASIPSINLPLSPFRRR